MAKQSKASNNSRGYSDNTIKRLFALSGNQCAFHTDSFECKERFVRDGRTDLMAQICHIEDAKVGGRYNPNMSNNQYADFYNLILLCPNHHHLKKNQNLKKSQFLLKIQISN